MDLEVQQFGTWDYKVPFFFVRRIKKNLKFFLRVDSTFALFFAFLQVYQLLYNYMVFERNFRSYIVLYTYIFCCIMDRFQESYGIFDTYINTTFLLFPFYLLPIVMEIIKNKFTSWYWLIICGHLLFCVNYLSINVHLNYYVMILTSISTGCLALIVYDWFLRLGSAAWNAIYNILNPY